jgi:colanic acid biosynthesis glycosyl transferase WcaI
MSRIVAELAALGDQIHVITALPWYLHHRVEPDWQGRIVRTERNDWGSITRVHPFPTDKTSIPRRAAAFGGFTALAGLAGLRGGRVDGVLAMSPPLTLGLTGYAMRLVRGGPLVFNIQDVFPDVAVELGAISNPKVISVFQKLEKLSYDRADAVTVLSDDLRQNVVAKVGERNAGKVRVIPNFVDTDAIKPLDRMTLYRAELGISDETVVLYAGNVGLSQSLDLVVGAAQAMVDDPSVVFLINGGGSGLETIRAAAAGLSNVRFAPYQPRERLAEVLATGDIHLVPLRRGLARSSVPSKTYSILAAGRPVLASVDAGTEVERLVNAASAGLAVPPDDPDAFLVGLRRLISDRDGRRAMGQRGRSYVESWASPAAVGQAYHDLFSELSRR